MADERISYREMAEQSIARSFKGILRVSNVLEANPEEPDLFLNPYYYAQPTGSISEQSEFIGDASAALALDGQTNRYSFPSDPYKHKKVPVTDSLGHYVNLNVGEGGTTIGSDELNNGNESDVVQFKQILGEHVFDQEKVFPVIKSDTMIIGLEPITQPENKSRITSGKLHVDSSPNNSQIVSQIIVNNNFDHTPQHIDEDGNYIALSTINDEYTAGTKFRTVYQLGEANPAENDILLHYQDNIDGHNLNLPEGNGKTIDSIVSIANLKQYVKEKLNKWLGYNTVEVPTGQIMWQYIDLKKWYCTDAKSGDYLGHQPPMNKLVDDNDYSSSLYQGVVKKGINRIVSKSKTETNDGTILSFKESQLQELIPLYKRDYALCDGSAYTIYMLLPEMKGNYDLQSYDQFINLFFALGYQYTDLQNIVTHYKNDVARVLPNGEKVYCWPGWAEGASNPINGLKEIEDKDVLFGIDLVTMFAIKAIYNELTYGVENNGYSMCIDPATEKFDRERAEEWLKTQPIPKEYIFNTPIPSSEGGMLFRYKPAPYTKGEIHTYDFEIGTEVNSFNSMIRYYSYADKQYVNCRVWQTAEVQSVLDLWAKSEKQGGSGSYRDMFLKTYYKYTFNVPNFVQTKDGKYTTGVWIGSSPYFWSNETETETRSFSLSTFSESSIPHRHFIAMGPQVFKEQPAYTAKTPDLGKNDMVRADGIFNWVDQDRGLGCKECAAVNVNSYSFAEMRNVKWDQEIQGGIPTYVIKFTNANMHNTPDPRWQNAEPNRGATSAPVLINQVKDEKYEQARANSSTGQAEYFMPESVQMIPLIKL